MPPSSGPSQREREIVEEELAVPLRRLRREVGDPTYERIAEDSGLCRNTVDNAFNARRLVRWRTVEAIVVALGGDTSRWRERWVAARGRLDALKAPAVVPHAEPVVPEPSASQRCVAEPVVVRRARRLGGRLPAALVGVVTVVGWGMAVAVLAFGSTDREASAARDRTGPDPVSIAQVRPVAGSPVYTQCSDRDRSVLSKPGRVRGGMPRGKLRPGDRFVVTSKTAYWRYGRVPGDPGRQGWVLAGYLCRIGG